MNESEVRGLKWNLKKVRGLVMHFSQINNILYTFIVLHRNIINSNWAFLIGYNLEMVIVFKGSSREPNSKGRKWKTERLERDLEIREIYLCYFCLTCQFS